MHFFIHNCLWVGQFINSNKPYGLPVGKMNNKSSVDKPAFYPQLIKNKTTEYRLEFYSEVHREEGRLHQGKTHLSTENKDPNNNNNIKKTSHKR